MFFLSFAAVFRERRFVGEFVFIGRSVEDDGRIGGRGTEKKRYAQNLPCVQSEAMDGVVVAEVGVCDSYELLLMQSEWLRETLMQISN